MKSPVVKRSIVVAGHKTSVSLEEAFWNGMKEISGERNMTLSELVGEIATAAGIPSPVPRSPATYSTPPASPCVRRLKTRTRRPPARRPLPFQKGDAAPRHGRGFSRVRAPRSQHH